MPRERDLFANFDRMRREMDELFGEAFDRRLAGGPRRGFRPAVDVFYESNPPRAIACVDLAGIDPDEVDLQISGRELTISGVRRGLPPSESRVYQQLEIETGAFRRVVPLGADVDPDRTTASYDRGILRIELPLKTSPTRTHEVEIKGPDQ